MLQKLLEIIFFLYGLGINVSRAEFCVDFNASKISLISCCNQLLVSLF